jgi:hypothetical protein
VTDRRYACECCGFRTLTQFGQLRICSVCFWEDDPVQNESSQFSGGANSLSLDQARQNFVKIGASQREFLNKVRSPTADEMPIHRLLVGLEKERQAEAQAHVHRQVKIQILAIIRGMLSSRISIVDGCAWVAMLALEVDSPWDDKLRVFRGVASETDEFPSGPARHEWDRNALAERTETWLCTSKGFAASYLPPAVNLRSH